MSRRKEEDYEKYNNYEMYKAFSDSPKSLRRNQIKILSQLNLINEHEVASSILKYIRENEKLVSKNIADDDIEMLQEIVNKWNKVCEVTHMEEAKERPKRKYSKEQTKALLEAYDKGLSRDECLEAAGFTTLTAREKTFYYNTIQRYKDNRVPKDLCPVTEDKEEKQEEIKSQQLDNIDEHIEDANKIIENEEKQEEIKSEAYDSELNSTELSTEAADEKISIDEVISRAKGKIEKSSAEITAIEMKIQALRKKEAELEEEQKRLMGIVEFCEEVQKSIKKEAAKNEKNKRN